MLRNSVASATIRKPVPAECEILPLATAVLQRESSYRALTWTLKFVVTDLAMTPDHTTQVIGFQRDARTPNQAG